MNQLNATPDQTKNTACFSCENLARLTEIMDEHKYSAGSYLFWEGDAADKLYYLKKGRVKITKSSDEGRQIMLYMHQEGDMFGQVDPFHPSTHSFHAQALEDVTVGVIRHNDLEVLLWQYGDLAVEFMKWMGLMHRMTQSKFRDLILFGKPGALCSLLIRLGNSYGDVRENGIFISRKFTNAELGEMIGATRESVNRMLGDLKQNHAIEYVNGHIVIKNLTYLCDICRCENCPKDICRI